MSASRTHVRGRWAHTAVALVLVLALAGCGLLAKARDDRRPDTAEPTAWDRVLAMAGPHGEVTKDMALAAFAATFGTLPGVPAPQGGRDGITSGSAAVRWLEGYWTELTPDQRTAADRWLQAGTPDVGDGEGDGAGPTAKPSTPTAKPSATATATSNAAPSQKAVPLRRSVPDAPPLAPTGYTPTPGSPAGRLFTCPAGTSRDPDIDTRASYETNQLAVRMSAATDHLHIRVCLADPAAFDPHGEVAPGVRAFADAGHDGTETVCRIAVLPPFRSDSRADQEFTLVEELTHCFSIAILPQPRFMLMPAWVEEGLAAWCAATLVGSIPGYDPSWPTYLTPVADTPDWTPLNRRGSSALGFWFHLSTHGVDLFPAIRRIKEAVPSGGDAVFTAATTTAGGPGRAALLDAWISALVRQPGRSREWDARGVGVTASSWVPKVSGQVTDHGPAYTQLSGPFGGQLGSVDLKAEVVRLWDGGSGSAHGRFGPGALDDYTFAQAFGKTFCTRGAACRCPDNSPGAGTAFTRIDSGPALVALTGGTDSAAVVVGGRSLADFCGKPADPREPAPHGSPASPSAPGPNGPEGPPSGCAGCGAGSSFGDPHLATFDGDRYDFQAAGEFTLVQAPGDGMRVQTRQEPVAGSRAVAVNTAVAADVAGDRVGFYLTGAGGVDVRLNGGATVPQAGVTALPKGGRLTRSGAAAAPAYAVAWPDGSTLFVTPIGGYGLKADLAVAAARAGGLSGLLGDFDGRPANDLVTAGGSALAQPPAWADLHGAFADHWRIRAEESLFDYAPGRSTASYTDRAFPAERPAAALPNRPAAEARCAEAGVTDPRLREACVADVALTGHDEFARSAGAEQKFQAAAGPGAGAGLPVDPACVVTTPGAANTKRFPVAVGDTVRTGGTGAMACAGYLPAGDWDHEFAFTGTKGTTVDLRHTGDADCRLRWSLYRDIVVRYSEATLLRKPVSVCRDLGPVVLPADGEYFVVVDKTDAAVAGTYGFTVGSGV
ncbi:VWD domain-containing protein [Yinghuangia seranimata]|uniref:VWD domain-containing protein n=1 Tax=Yinghuangia seranimata TaxID=408067 RepID=UPI00248C8658|nr:VWD domain-containing protein [Yinghuangia seranimata]MDI2124857.1 VWD domain-containing protein [Yinghuangia seranimata]